MSRLPIPHFIQEIKTKLGFDRTMTASGDDVVDAVNKQSQQIDELGPYNGLDSDSTAAALSAAQGKALDEKKLNLADIGIVNALSERLVNTVSGNEYSACSVQSLPKGTYLVIATASFQLTNATGERECGIYLDTTGVENMAVPGNSVGWPRVQCCAMIELRTASEIHIRIKQNSGNNISVGTTLFIAKLK